MSISTATGPEPHVVLDLFARVRGIPDTQIAEVLEVHRNSVARKKSGFIPLQSFELDVLAAGFGVPIEVFREMTGLEAMRWAVENRPDWFTPNSPAPTPITEARSERLAAKLQSPAGVVQW